MVLALMMVGVGQYFAHALGWEAGPAKTPFWCLPGVAYDEQAFTVYVAQDDRQSRLQSAYMR